MLQLGGNGGMSMLKSITLENYKCFKDRTTIDIAPLTVLCGVNSSGKSSILKSLLMMKQSVEKDTPYNKLSFMGNYVDNGYFDNVVNSNVKENDDATFTIENTFVLKGFDRNQKKRQDMGSYKELRRLYNFKDNIDSFVITHSIVVSKSYNDVSEKTLLAYIENNDVIKTYISIDVYNNFGIEEIQTFVGLEKIVGKEREYHLIFKNIPFENNYITNEGYPFWNTCQCYFNNIKLTNIYKPHMSHRLFSAKPIILSLFNIVSQQYAGVEFIAPLRHNPMRTYTIKGDVSSVGISGEDSPILYTKLCENPQKYKTDVASPVKIDNGSYNNGWFINFNTLKKNPKIDFKTSVQRWMDYFELGQITYTGTNGLMELRINGNNISDVGFGVSQIFPIIVQGLQMSKDSVLLLEQPEIHLHPQMQMRMADFLLAVTTSERNIIVETHSDHIINRLVKRIMSDKAGNLNNNIHIYFVDKHSQNTVERISISPTKGIINAPMQFFTQFATETMDIAQIGFNNHKEGVDWVRNE